MMFLTIFFKYPLFPKPAAICGQLPFFTQDKNVAVSPVSKYLFQGNCLNYFKINLIWEIFVQKWVESFSQPTFGHHVKWETTPEF